MKEQFCLLLTTFVFSQAFYEEQLVAVDLLVAASAPAFPVNRYDVIVQGELRCHQKPAAGVEIHLAGSDFVSDVKTKSDDDGRFYLNGTLHITSFPLFQQPVVRILHSCSTQFCKVLSTIPIEKRYLSTGEVLLISRELSVHYKGDKLKCSLRDELFEGFFNDDE
ncbi:unnamed protein product, partial [Mesorhabditis spiculigera]